MKPFLRLSIASLFALNLASNASAIEVEFERDPSLPLVYLNVAVKTGTVTDPEGLSGISSFMANMLRRGTQSRTKEQIDLALDQMGGSLAVETRAEAVILRGAVLAKQLGPYLDLVKDIVTQPSFPEHEIRKLKGETVSEIIQELGSDSKLGRRAFERFLFSGHPYGKPISGTTKAVESFTREQIQSHYDRLFRDPLLLVVGSGDADPSRIREFARALGAARQGGSAKLANIPAPPVAEKRRLLLVDKPDRTQTQINIGQVGVTMTDPEFFPLYLANHAFGGGSFSARLMVEIRVKRGWSYGAYSYFRHGRKPRSWQMYTFPATSYTPEALTELFKLLERFRQDGVTAEEFDFAKTSLVNSSGFMFNTPAKRVDNALLEKTLDLPEGFMETYGKEVSRLTIEQVNRAAKKYFDSSRATTVVVATVTPELKKKLAEATQVPAAEVKVEPYTAE